MKISRMLVTAMGGGAVYSISGVVYDADGTTPVEGATVALGALSAVSAANGTYTISNVLPGTSGSMTCTKTGYSWDAISVAEMTGNLTNQNYRASYIQRMLALFGDAIISYLPFNDASGNPQDASANNRDGAISGIITLGQTGIGDGQTSVLFGGGYINWYSASLAAAFNNGEGSVLIWVKIPDAVWDDNAEHNVFRIAKDGNNYVRIYKAATDRIVYEYDAAGTIETVIISGVKNTDWIPLAITWSVTNDQVICYRLGVQAGSTQTGLGTWTGALSNSLTLLGGWNASTSLFTGGYQAHALLLNRPATPEEVLSYSNLT